MGRWRSSILLAVSLGVAAAIGSQPVQADTVIDAPPPPRQQETGSFVLDMFAAAVDQVQTAADGHEAFLHYSTRRFAPRNVYTTTPTVSSSWSARADAYARSWYINNGPRIWGTWWPWGAWGGGCTMWTIGWPGQHAGMSTGCVGTGITFATLGGGY